MAENVVFVATLGMVDVITRLAADMPQEQLFGSLR